MASRFPLLVIERHGHWAAAIRLALDDAARLGGAAVRIVELRSLDDLWPALDNDPAALVALELTAAGVEEVARALLRLEREYPAARAFAVAERHLAAYSGVIREAGALVVIDSPRKLAAVCQIVTRLAAEPPLAWRCSDVSRQAAVDGLSSFDIFAELPLAEGAIPRASSSQTQPRIDHDGIT